METRRLPSILAAALLAFAASLPSGCTQAGKLRRQVAAPPPLRIGLAYTNDEHGWIEGTAPGRGAAELAGLVAKEMEGQDELLWLSGGDNWTGPAISTWFEGRSVVEVMNAVGYRAAAVGNHEFDFGLASLAARAREAAFPYLAANLRRRDDGRFPEELGVRSHVVIDLGAVRLGVIGLVTTETPRVTVPSNVASLEFLPYEPALREAVAAARAEGATAIVVLAHACVQEVRRLAEAVADLEVAVFAAGHCNERLVAQLGSSVLLSTGGHLRDVALVSLRFDRRNGRLLGIDPPRSALNEGGPPDPAVEAIVERWRARTEDELGRPIAWLAERLPRRDHRLGRLIVESWLEAWPVAEIALMNRGGVRADLPGGAVSLADVVAVLPFRSTIVEAEVPGAVLERAIAAHRPIVGGLERGDAGWVLAATGEPLRPERRYRVLANSFCYAGGDGWDFLAESDPGAYDTGLHFRQPLIDWFEARPSSAESPLRP